MLLATRSKATSNYISRYGLAKYLKLLYIAKFLALANIQIKDINRESLKKLLE
jgi:hypothetical protein